MLLVTPTMVRGVSPYPMAGGDYLETFGNIATWANNFVSPAEATRWGSAMANTNGTIPDGLRVMRAATNFTTLTTGGVQKDFTGGGPRIALLSTGPVDNTNSTAIDLYLDFTGRLPGTLSFDWVSLTNSTGNRASSLRIYTSTNAASFTELAAAAVLNLSNNVVAAGSIANIPLPSIFSNCPTARIRFYEYNGTGGSTGSRACIGIDNVAATSLPINFLVTTTNDSGAGSLRQMLEDAASGSAITFTNTLSGTTILLTSGQLLLNKNLTIDASMLPGGLTINGCSTNRIFQVNGGTTNSLLNLTLTGGNGAGASASGSGGAIYNQGKLLLRGCTISGNSASSGGGGIFSETAPSQLLMTNCTVTGNTASFGGGFLIRNSSAVSLVHCTVSGNVGTGGSGGVVLESSGSLFLQNTIVAANGDDLGGCGGTLTRSGNNIIGAQPFCYPAVAPVGAPNIYGDYVGTSGSLVNPLLSPLGNNGGSTLTMSPLPGSPAIDRCTNSTTILANDQRGFPRPMDGDGNGSSLADIGAVELGFPPIVFTQPVTNTTLTTATLEAAVNPRGAVTTYYFEYGTTTNYGNFSATNSLPGSNFDIHVTATITGLTPGNAYHFRTVAANPYGINLGDDQIFTTPSYPVLAVSPEADQSTFRGYANPFLPIVPTNFVYVLMNVGSVPLDWSVDYLSDWLTASTTSGTLPAGVSTQINIWINDSNFLLGTEIFPDNWVGVVRIQNQTASTTTEWHILLQVIPPVSSGGVALWGASTTAPAFVPGLFRVSIEPTNLVAQGAAWHPLNATPDPGWSQDTTNWFYPFTPTNTLEFFPVPGYLTATNQRVLVTPGSPTVLHAVYVPIPAPPLLLLGPEVLSGGKLRFSLNGPTGKVYAVQISTNLAAWNDLLFLTNTTGTNVFTNTPAIGADKQFFRARQLP